MHKHMHANMHCLACDSICTDISCGLSTPWLIWACRNRHGTWEATDMHAIGFMKPLQDPQQDVVLRGQPLAFGNRTLAVFKRPLTPCDTEHDLPFLAGTPQTVIWAIGQSSALAYHGNANRGYTVVDFQPLLANDTAAAGLPCISDSSSIIHNTSSNIQNNSSNIHNNSGSIQNNSSSNIPALPDAVPSSGCPSIKEPVQVADLTFNNQLIPPQETTYMCKFIHLPSDRKYHIVSYTGVVTSKFLHHMVLDKCRRVRNDFVIQIFRGASTCACAVHFVQRWQLEVAALCSYMQLRCSHVVG